VTDRSPGLGIGLGASVALHVALITAVFLAGHPPPIASPREFRVHLVAAPEGTPEIGVVAAKPAVPVVKPAPLPPAVARPERKAPVPAPKAAPKQPPPKQVTAAPTPVEQPTPVVPPPPAPAAGSDAPGTGSDLAALNLGGVDFPHPEYLSAMVNVIKSRFGSQNGRLEVTVRFTIHRDGTTHDIERVGAGSGSYTFDKRALAAVDGAKFDALPADFHDDALTVIFTFSPPKPPT